MNTQEFRSAQLTGLRVTGYIKSGGVWGERQGRQRRGSEFDQKMTDYEKEARDLIDLLREKPASYLSEMSDELFYFR